MNSAIVKWVFLLPFFWGGWRILWRAQASDLGNVERMC